ncbi:uncharacterized protein LOC127709143 isoform X4 [Mytilus californianus]|uniref:uncharacterized protein LOC127709143 isoform X4 n=1 Tax=Mytilus californianus TaxID=6549 RepID=UPI0022451AA5|nr:uncharacterized protein LOC127709143 isoform X4 [Mytilus californianus]
MICVHMIDFPRIKYCKNINIRYEKHFRINGRKEEAFTTEVVIFSSIQLFDTSTVVMDGWMNGWMDEWMDGWMEGWINGWMDGWMTCWLAWMDA